MTVDHAPRVSLGGHVHLAMSRVLLGVSCIASSGVGVLRKRGRRGISDCVDTLGLDLSGFCVKQVCS